MQTLPQFLRVPTLAPGLLPAPGAGPIQLRRIVFLEYQADAPFSLQALSRARATTWLMSGLANNRTLPGHGLSEAARLARQIPAFRLSYGNCGQLGDHGDKLWGDPSPHAG